MGVRRPAQFAGVASRVYQYLRASIRIDSRALAAFRISVALLMLVDILLRARNFRRFYTDAGVVPQALAQQAAPIDVPSLYFISTDPAVTAGLFVLHGVIALQLLIGYRTRIATLLAVVFVVSLGLRNPLVLSYADILFAWLLLWALFVPLGERWSVDSLHRDRSPRPAIVSVGSALILLQMVTMYVVNGYHKTSSDLWHSGEAAVLVLGLDDMTFLLAELAVSVPIALQYGGQLWFYMLLCGWLLVCLQGRPRTLLVGLFIAGHLSFAVTVRIGAFAFVAIAGLILFLPPSFWDALDSRLQRSGLVNSRTSAVFSRLELAVRRLPQRRSRALLTLRQHQFILKLRRLMPTLTVRQFGVGALLIAGVVASLAVGGVVDQQGGTVEPVQQGTEAFVDHQTEWRIFAPTPRTSAQYYVFAAVTESGTQRDLYGDRPLSYDRPAEPLESQYETYRDRFYMNTIASGDPPGAQTRLAASLCAEQNATHSDPIVQLKLYQIREQVTPETLTQPAERERTSRQVYTHECSDSDPKPLDEPPF